MQYSNPLIVQSDKTLLLDVHAPLAEECRNALIPFAELERSPGHLHTYRLSPLSLWNASSAGISTEQIISSLEKFAKYDVPQSVKDWIEDTANKFGKIKIKGIEDFSPHAGAGHNTPSLQVQSADNDCETEVSPYLHLSTP